MSKTGSVTPLILFVYASMIRCKFLVSNITPNIEATLVAAWHAQRYIEFSATLNWFEPLYIIFFALCQKLNPVLQIKMWKKKKKWVNEFASEL